MPLVLAVEPEAWEAAYSAAAADATAAAAAGEEVFVAPDPAQYWTHD